MPRVVEVVACLADASLYTTEDDLVYGMDGSDLRNERMIIKAAGHLGATEPGHHRGPAEQTACHFAWRSVYTSHAPRRFFDGVLSTFVQSLANSTASEFDLPSMRARGAPPPRFPEETPYPPAHTEALSTWIMGS